MRPQRIEGPRIVKEERLIVFSEALQARVRLGRIRTGPSSQPEQSERIARIFENLLGGVGGGVQQLEFIALRPPEQ